MTVQGTISKSVAAFYVISMLTLFFSLYAGMIHNQPSEFSYSILLLSTNTLIFAAVFIRRQWHVFYPMGLFFLLIAFSSTMKTIFIGLSENISQNDYFWSNYLSGAIALFVFTLVMIPIVILVDSGGMRSAGESRRGRIDHFRITLITLLAIGLAVTAFYLYYKNYGSGAAGFISKKFKELDVGVQNRFVSLQYWSYKLTILSKLSFYVMMAMFLLRKARLPVVIAGIISFLLSIVLGLYFDNRSEILIITIDLLLLSSIAIRNKMMFRSFMTILSVVFLGLFFYVTLSRLDDFSMDMVVNVLFNQRYLASPDKIGTIINAPLEDFGLLYFRSYLGFLMLPIPEISEPFKSLHFVVAEMAFDTTRNAVPPGGIAESYINGGYFSLLTIAAATGFLLALLQKKMRISYLRGDYVSLILLVVFATRFVFFFINTDMGTALLKATFEMLLVYSIFYVSGLKRDRVYE